MPKTQTLEQTKLSEPKMYKVILLNDDVTTMDFVIEILMNIFHQNLEKASQTPYYLSSLIFLLANPICS